MTGMDLTTIWAFVIAFAVFMYVVMDGFDLGIGILFPSFRPGEERTQAMNAIAPVWDGNETWLVLGGGGLMAAFPLAYAIILPATYPLIVAMLLGLVFRGVAFEYRHRDPSHERFWDFAFFAGSLVAALSQGMILGALLQGIAVDGRAYAGGWLDWLSPYSLLTGAGVVVGYTLLGSCFLAMKLTGEAEERAYRLAMRAGLATLQKIERVNAFKQLEERTAGFCDELNARFDKRGLPFQITRVGSLFWLHARAAKVIRQLEDIPAKHAEQFARIFHAALKRGVYFAPSSYEVSFMSLAHTDELLNEASRAIVDAVEETFPSPSGRGLG